MTLSCPFCKQLLIEAFQHVEFMYAVCFKCFKRIVQKFRILDFQRISFLKDKRTEHINIIKKANQELIMHLKTNIFNFGQVMRKNVLDEYFDRLGDYRKSQQSTVSTNLSLSYQSEENPQSNSKQMSQKLKQAQLKAQQSTSTIEKLSMIKEKIASTGISLIQKIKESERYEKQVENLANYKEKIMQRGEVVKNKLSKFKSDFKDMKSQLPSLKETIKGIEIGSMLKSKLFGKW